jgi:hypothetical protein
MNPPRRVHVVTTASAHVRSEISDRHSSAPGMRTRLVLRPGGCWRQVRPPATRISPAVGSGPRQAPRPARRSGRVAGSAAMPSWSSPLRPRHVRPESLGPMSESGSTSSSSSEVQAASDRLGRIQLWVRPMSPASRSSESVGRRSHELGSRFRVSTVVSAAAVWAGCGVHRARCHTTATGESVPDTSFSTCGAHGKYWRQSHGGVDTKLAVPVFPSPLAVGWTALWIPGGLTSRKLHHPS